MLKWLWWCVVSMILVAAVFSGFGLLLYGPAPVAACLGAVLAYLGHDSIDAKINRIRR